MKLSEITEDVTPAELNHLKHYIVNQFRHLGLDLRFGHHFYQRVNDPRNKKPITIGELTRLFRKTLQKYGKDIASLPPETQVVLKDLATKINVPIVKAVEEPDEPTTVVAKSVMRKPNFGTTNPVFAIEQQLDELGYKGNIGFMELVQFSQKATQEQKDLLQQLIADKNITKAWHLIQKVVKAKLEPFTESTITEGKNHPIIVVDVQPEYANFSRRNAAISEKIIQFVSNQTGPVLMFVNAEQEGLSGDTVSGIVEYWNRTVDGDEPYDYDEEADEYVEREPTIDWNRFTIVDKGFGWFRSYMDQGVPESKIIRLIRTLYLYRMNDARDLFYEEYVDIMGDDRLIDEAFSINWASVAQLKRFSGAYIVGGGRNECLREVELLMNAFNIRYRRIDSLVY